jgi:pimeloyl-ACP methyl ester carboxylesterase
MTVNDWALPERFATEGGEIAWGRVGAGPPVVLVHGTPWSSWSWRQVVPHLVDRFSVFVFDLLGFGTSDQCPGQDVSIAGHAERFAQLVGFWELDRPAVIAHDIGGAIALRAHLLHEVAVRSFSFIDVVAIGTWGSPFYRLVREHADVFEQLPAPIHEGVLRAYIGTAQVRPWAGTVEQSLITPWLGPKGQNAFYRQIAQGDQEHTRQIESRYAQITVPTLIVWGEQDPWIPLARGRELAERIPGARFELIPDAGHLVLEEEPERLARLLAAHLPSEHG